MKRRDLFRSLAGAGIARALPMPLEAAPVRPLPALAPEPPNVVAATLQLFLKPDLEAIWSRDLRLVPVAGGWDLPDPLEPLTIVLTRPATGFRINLVADFTGAIPGIDLGKRTFSLDDAECTVDVGHKVSITNWPHPLIRLV